MHTVWRVRPDGLPVLTSLDRPSRRRAVVLTLALSFVLAVAAPVRAESDGIAEAAGVTDPLDYVALGDSYSAGQGIEPVLDVAPQDASCGRSARAWPLSVKDLGVGAPIAAAPERFAFPACSGAGVANVLSSPQATEHGVQIDAVGAGTDIVTVTIGGNDVEFAEVLRHCATTAACWTSDFLELSSGSTLSLREWVAVRLRHLEEELVGVYEAIRQRTSPHATVVVASYPKLFATHSGRRFGCSEFAFFTAEERSGLNAAAMELEQVIRRAADRAGIEFAPMTEVFAGHEICSQDFPGNEWLVGVDYQWSWPWDERAVGPASFHPNHLGAQAYSDTMNAVLEAALTGTSSRTAARHAVAPPMADPALGRTPELTDVEVDEVLALQLDALDLSDIATRDGGARCDGTAVPAQQLRLVADGFAPGLPVEISLQGERQPETSYARVTAGADGRVTAGIVLPELLTGPTVRIEAVGEDAGGGQRRELAVFWAADADGVCGRLAQRTGQLSVDGRPARAAGALSGGAEWPAWQPLLTPQAR